MWVSEYAYVCTYVYDAQMYVDEYIHIRRKHNKNLRKYLWMVGP